MTDATEKQPKVLFVDDEENILRAIERLFMDEPYTVQTANSGPDALELLRQNRDVAVIVSDQRMAGMSGAEFLEKARDLLPDAVRIVLTGYTDIQAAVDAINKGGAYRYIGKPWNDEELVAVVRDAASRYALVRENKRLTEVVHRQNAELRRWNSHLEYFVRNCRTACCIRSEGRPRSTASRTCAPPACSFGVTTRRTTERGFRTG